jgi:hypothetical protein
MAEITHHEASDIDGAKVDTKNPERGPLLVISGEKDHTVPWAIAIDHGWREVADTALGFVQRFPAPEKGAPQ